VDGLDFDWSYVVLLEMLQIQGRMCYARERACEKHAKRAKREAACVLSGKAV
jgi:hypothetical protein